MAKNLTEAEFWWMIGILEGEGFFDFNNGTQRISLGMTDLDIVEKMASIYTKITGRKYSINATNYTNDNYKTRYDLHVFGEGARTILGMIVPHMGIRRRQRMWQIINGYRQPPQTTKLDIGQILEFISAKK